MGAPQPVGENDGRALGGSQRRGGGAGGEGGVQGGPSTGVGVEGGEAGGEAGREGGKAGAADGAAAKVSRFRRMRQVPAQAGLRYICIKLMSSGGLFGFKYKMW